MNEVPTIHYTPDTWTEADADAVFKVLTEENGYSRQDAAVMVAGPWLVQALKKFVTHPSIVEHCECVDMEVLEFGRTMLELAGKNAPLPAKETH